MITYVLTFSLCSGFLLLVYRVLLLPEKLYKFNRFYLIFSLVFSLLIPIMSVHIPYNRPPSLNQQVVIQTNTSFATPTDLKARNKLAKASDNISLNDVIVEKWASNHNIILFFSCIITLLMCFRFIRNLYFISLEISRNTVINLNDIMIVLLDRKVTPHSFLKYVFIAKNDYINNLTEPEIICHEQAHANQLHSLDIIFIEILQAVCWFNPFIFLYRKAVQLNHEFLADEVVLEKHHDTAAYQYLVLAKLNKPSSTYLTSQFNYLTTKKRLIMMTKNTSGKTAFFKQVAILPIIVSAVLLFGNANGMEKTAPKGNKLIYGNSFFSQTAKFPNVKRDEILTSNILNEPKTIQTVKAQMTDTPRSIIKKQKHPVNVSKSAPVIVDNSKNTFSTKAAVAASIADTSKNTFSTQAVVQDENTKTKNTFSTAMGKERTSGSDMLDFTNKLILIRGKEATKDQLSSLSLAKIKFIKPFKGTDDLGNGTFEKIYGEKAKNGGFWIVLKNSDDQ